jgi:membrane protease YdiL (CAAX protease family)
MDLKSFAATRTPRTTPVGPEAAPAGAVADRYADVKQYSKGQVFSAWATAVVPMGLLAWLVAPWLSNRLGGPDPFISALLLCFIVGLLWELALLALLVHREQGTLRWSRVSAALWLRRPRSARTGRTGGRVWWWVVPFVLLSAVINGVGIDPVGPVPRDLPTTLELDAPRLEHFFHGNWGGFALLVAMALLSPIVEELFFRGLLLPRMRSAFGTADVVVNGVIFGLYHLHQPWSIPASVIDGIVTQAYPTKRFQSTWIALCAHTAPSFVIIGAVVPLVL